MGIMIYNFQILVKASVFLKIGTFYPNLLIAGKARSQLTEWRAIRMPQTCFFNINYISQFCQNFRFYQLQQVDFYNLAGGRMLAEERLLRYPKIGGFGRM